MNVASSLRSHVLPRCWRFLRLWLPIAAGLVTAANGQVAFSGDYTLPPNVVVGNTGVGALSISNGSSLWDISAVIGNQPGSSGSVTVNGAGSTWTNAAELAVGGSGFGLLQITNGGSVSSGYSRVGIGWSNGWVLVNGYSSTWTNSGMDIGAGGLVLSRGGTINSSGPTTAAGSTFVVTDSGSFFTTDSLLAITGDNPSFYIANGGVVFSHGATTIVGNSPVSVAGQGRLITGDLSVGGGGVGSLKITAGGLVHKGSGDRDMCIGEGLGGVGTVVVDGAGSTPGSTSLVSEAELVVGRGGGTGSLEIANGGSVISTDSVIVGAEAGGSGTLTVDGPGSTLTGNGGVYVGDNGGTGSIRVTNGGSVFSNDGRTGVSNGVITVDGAGSSWINSGSETIEDAGITVPAILTVGASGAPGVIAIANGGSVASGEVIVVGGTVIVDGTGSRLTASDSFFAGEGDSLSLGVGCLGAGSLTIANGGTVNVRDGSGAVSLGVNRIELGSMTLNGAGAGTLNIGGAEGASAAAGGVLNAAVITTGRGAGTVRFNTTADADSPYHFTRNGTAAGEAIAITGGTHVVNAAGYNVLTGANTYIGGTDIAGGTLAIGSGGSIRNDSTIANNSSFVVASDAAVSGSGSYTQTAGSTRIDGSFTQGSVQVQAGSFTNTGTTTVTGDMTNAGSLVIEGSSAVVNVGGTFRQTAAGSSTVLHGGSLQSSETDVTAGLFGGMGTVTGTVSVTGGVITVGGSPDTLAIHGNYTQSGGSLVFEIDPNGSGGFLNSVLMFDPDHVVSIANTSITFDFSNGADPAAFLNDGFFNVNTFFALSDGRPFGSRYDLSSVFQGDRFVVDSPGCTIGGFNSSTGAFDVTVPSRPVPESSATLALLVLGLGSMIAAEVRAFGRQRAIRPRSILS